MTYLLKFQQHKSRYQKFVQWKPNSVTTINELFEQLSDHITKWKKKETPAAQDEYYLNHLFPAVLEIFNWQVQYDLAHPETGHLVFASSPRQDIPHPELLVQFVGFSIEPLLLMVSVLKPEKLLLYFSKETERNFKNPLCSKWLTKYSYKGEVKDKIPINGKNICLIDSSNTENIVKAIHAGVNHLNPSGKVAIDITGGKKVMSASAFLEATISDFDIYYVDHEEYEESMPFPGTEFLSKLPSPMYYQVLYRMLLRRFNGDETQAKSQLKKILEILGRQEGI